MDLSELSQQILSSNRLIAKLPGAPLCTPMSHSEYFSRMGKGELKHEKIARFGAEVHKIPGDCLVAETRARA